MNKIVKFIDRAIEINARFDGKTIWLRQDEISKLFNKDRSVITKHINNIFKDKEVDEKSNVQKMHFPNSDKSVKLYSLDIALAVGYRTKSSTAIKFRQWATKILKNIYQTFGKVDLIPAVEEKAANLFYYIVKDYPFVDGNKRIGAFLFVLFLSKNNYLYGKDGELKINSNALVSLALLIAFSNASEKELIIKLIVNLIGE